MDLLVGVQLHVGRSDANAQCPRPTPRTDGRTLSCADPNAVLRFLVRGQLCGQCVVGVVLVCLFRLSWHRPIDLFDGCADANAHHSHACVQRWNAVSHCDADPTVHECVDRLVSLHMQRFEWTDADAHQLVPAIGRAMSGLQ